MMTGPEPPLLEAKGLYLGYGDLTVVTGIDLSVQAGEVVALVGPNGAGKTTLLKGLAGLLPAKGGTICWRGQPIQALVAARRVRLGLSLAPEGRGLFSGLTVEENLRMGAYTRGAVTRDDLERVYTLLPELRTPARQLAGTLSGGQQQMCAIGRALMARPQLLMIDELSLGLAPIVVERLMQALAQIHKDGTTVLLVDQDVPVALGLAHRAYVLERGSIALEGPAAELIADPHVQEAYLGTMERGGRSG